MSIVSSLSTLNPWVKPRAVRPWGLVVVMFATLLFSPHARGQVFTWTPEQMVKYTAQNPYGRFPDGRPKVPDSILEKLKEMCSEEVLGMVRRGYPSQFAEGLLPLHPGKKLVGRALTLQLMPLRPDIADVQAAEWKQKGGGRLSHQAAIDMLQPGDVFVADVFGSAAAGGIVGDNLAYYIWKTTGAGFVIDGAIRDLEGIAGYDMAGYFRAATPPAIRGVMVTGINTPVRIGNVTVIPGDVVLGDREGVNFIPPQLVQELVDEAEITHIHDEWTRMKFDEGKYKSSEIYGRPSDPALITEYEEFLKKRLGDQRYQEYRKRRGLRK